MLENRTESALLVVDVQVGVMTGAHERDAVVGRVAELVERARRDEVPVVWVQHQNDGLVPDGDAWQLVPELAPREGEVRIRKAYGDAFEQAPLEAELARLGVGRLVVAGAQTDACIRSTIHGAFARGYDTLLVSDAHTTEDLTEWGAPPPGDVIAHTNLYWGFEEAPGRTAGTATTAEVELRPAPSGD